MLLLDSGRRARKSVATSTLDLEELQRENTALVAELGRARRRRRIKRIRRYGFLVVPIVRAAAKRLGKSSSDEQPTDSVSAEPKRGPDRRVEMVVIALVLRRLLETRTPRSAANPELPSPAKVQS
jgi:hypothetical protein